MRLPPFEAEDFTVERIRDFRSVVDGDQQNRGQSFALADVKSVTIEKPCRIGLAIDVSFSRPFRTATLVSGDSCNLDFHGTTKSYALCLAAVELQNQRGVHLRGRHNSVDLP
jgi:hypothetical protein